jgi:hypothetical protein
MRAVGQAASGKAEDDGCISNTAEDDNAVSRRLGADPRRQGFTGRALVSGDSGTGRGTETTWSPR